MYLTLAGTSVSRVPVDAYQWNLHREGKDLGAGGLEYGPVEAAPLSIDLAAGAAAIEAVEATTLGKELSGALEVCAPATRAGVCFQTIRFSAAYVELTELDTDANTARLAINVGALKWSTLTVDPDGQAYERTLTYDFATRDAPDFSVVDGRPDRLEGVPPQTGSGTLELAGVVSTVDGFTVSVSNEVIRSTTSSGATRPAFETIEVDTSFSGATLETASQFFDTPTAGGIVADGFALEFATTFVTSLSISSSLDETIELDTIQLELSADDNEFGWDRQDDEPWSPVPR